MLSKDLSAAEMALVFNSDWLLMKHRIMEKAVVLLGEVQAELALLPVLQDTEAWKPYVAMGGKISKGERYKELPYAILDYPRHFSREDIFALRTMFWWGHDFIVTLHLAGTSLDVYRPGLRAGLSALQDAGAHVYLPEDPWQHEIEGGVYLPLSACSQVEWEAVLERRFVKIAAPFALGNWGQLVPDALRFYTTVLQVLHASK